MELIILSGYSNVCPQMKQNIQKNVWLHDSVHKVYENDKQKKKVSHQTKHKKWKSCNCIKNIAQI